MLQVGPIMFISVHVCLITSTIKILPSNDPISSMKKKHISIKTQIFIQCIFMKDSSLMMIQFNQIIIFNFENITTITN